MTNKLFIADLDGVLITSRELHYDALNAALAKVGEEYVISRDEHLSTYDGLGTTLKLKMLTEHKGLPVKFHQQIWEDKQKATFALIKKFPQDQRAITIFKELRERGWKIAVASNAVRESVKLALMTIGVMEYVDYYVSNEDVQNQKPNPQMYWSCMTAMNALPRDTIIMEDSHIGRQGALDSGAHLLAVENSDDWNREKIFNEVERIENLTKMKKSVPWIDSKLNIVIPMSGLGSRFQEAGYVFPKPLIEVNGKAMIQAVVENLNIKANYIFICQQEHYDKYDLKNLLERIAPNCKIVLTNGMTEGAACSILLAKEFIDNENPLLLANSDQIMDWNSNECLYSFKNDNLDGGILTFEATHPRWSYVRRDEKTGFVTEVKEKKVISDEATCFHYDQSIVLVDGRSYPIGLLVNSKITGEVWSFNEKTKQFEAKQIKNWIKNNNVNTTWYDVSFFGATKTTNGKQKLARVTNDHQFLTERGYIRADKLLITDKLLTSFKKPNKFQSGIINGTILGDGHYKRPNKFGEKGRLSFKHSLLQKDWFDLKVKSLTDLKPSVYCEPAKEEKVLVMGNKVNHNGALTAMFSNPLWEIERNRWYPNGTKIIPEDLIIDDITLAVWYLDDGSLLSDKSSAILCTDSFDENSIDTLVLKMKELGIYVTKQKKRSGYRLCIYNGSLNNSLAGKHFSSDEFFNRISRYVPPSMQYKIPELFRGRYEDWSEQTSESLFLNAVVKKSILTTKREKNSTKNSYCIEVEDNHNFITCDMVVSNCGIYYFSKGSDFVKYAEQMITANDRVNGEFYTVPVYQYAINDGKKIRAKRVEAMWGIGIPSDLDYFLNNYKGKI